MNTYKHYLRGELVGEYPMPAPSEYVGPGDWTDKDLSWPLCSEHVEYPPEKPTFHTTAPLLRRIRILLRWNVMDRLRYLGLWPRRPSIRGAGCKTPSGTIWGDMWRWARTTGTCAVLGHVKVEWFNPAPYAIRYRCDRCDKMNL